MGYATLAIVLLAVLTLNGATGLPAAATIVTSVLFCAGLLLAAAGMLRVSRGRGVLLQSAGLIGLLPALVLLQFASSVSGYVVAAAVITLSAVVGCAGAVLLRTPSLILGTALVFLGAGVVAASDIAGQFLISSLQNTVLVDIGATVSACGCVLAAYSFFVLRGEGEEGR